MKLETGRLLMRELLEADVAPLLRLYGDEEAMRYYPSTKDAEQTMAWIQRNLTSYREHGYGIWAVVRKADGRFLGQCGLIPQRVRDRDETELGYSLIREYWGAGYATEAARRCLDYAFAEAGMAQIVSFVDVRNAPSVRVAERVGMKREARLESNQNKWEKPIFVYTIDRDVWKRGHERGTG